MHTNSIEAPLSLWEMLRLALPHFGISHEVALWRLRNLPNFWRGFWRVAIARVLGVPHMVGQLRLRVFREGGEVIDLGLASLRAITNDGAEYLVQGFLGVTDITLFLYHGFGSDLTGELDTDTELGTEFSTQYAVNSTRPTGVNNTGAALNILRSVALFTPDAAVTVREHGLFNQDTAFIGTLWDRSVFADISLNGTGDALQSTYDCTFTAGG